MSNHPIDGLMTTAMENLKDMIEANTIIGDPIETDGSTIIPVSKVGFGFAAGGSDLAGSDSGGQQEGEEAMPFCGGSGGGVSVAPVAFLVISKDGIKMIHLDEHTHIYEKLIDKAPETIEKLQKMLKGSNVRTASASSRGSGKRQERRTERHEEEYE